jgi:hypothetical protein
MGSGDDEPGLTPQERSTLDPLEAALKDNDPKLQHRLTPRSNPLRRLEPRRRFTIGLVAATIGLMITMGSFTWSLPVAVVGLVLAGAGMGLGIDAVKSWTPRSPFGRR